MLAKWPRGEAENGTPDEGVVRPLGDDLNTVAAIQALHGLAQAANADADRIPAFLASASLLGFEMKAQTLEQGIGDAIQALVDMRLEMIKAKNWAEADRIRDELSAKGIQLKDGKDPETGERVTTWEVKR